MSDTVTKELKVRVSAEDETSGVWDGFKANIDAAKEWMTPLNQAWELSAKLWGKISDAASAAIGVIADGGQFNETATAFEALSRRTQLGGDEMVRTLQEVTGGVMGIEEAMNVASQAMNRGFSSASLGAMSTFAKRLEEATGDSMEATIDQIERAITTGQRLERLEMFGLHITKGMEASEVIKELEAATKRFGAGAFNFGDLWAGAWQKVGDTVKIVGREINLLMGKDGFVENAFKGFNAGLSSVQANAPALAAALWTPVRQIGQWLDILTTGTKDLGEMAVAAVGAVGNGLYRLMGTMGQVIDGFVSMSAKGTEFRKWYSGILGDKEDVAAAEKELLWLEGMATWADNVAAARLDFNTAILSAHQQTQRTAEVLNTGLKRDVEMVNVGNRGGSAAASSRGRNVLWQSGDSLDTSGGSTQSSNQPWQMLKGDTSGAKVVQLAAPPADALMGVLVDWINKAIVKENAQGAGA